MEDKVDKSPDELKKDEILKLLDRYNVKNRVAVVSINNETEMLMDMDENRLKTATVEQLGEWSIMLAKYAYYIQKLINSEKAVEELAEANIRKIIYKDYAQYKKPYSSTEETKYAAILGNEVATLWERVRVNARVCISLLQDLPFSINKMSDKVENYKRAKQKWMQTQ